MHHSPVRALGLLLLMLSTLPAAIPPSIGDIGLGTPRLIIMELTEHGYTRGQLQPRTPDGRPAGSWIATPQGDALIMGDQGQWLRPVDRWDGSRLARSAMDNANGYRITGGNNPRVRAVYRKSVPVGVTERRHDSITPFKHFIYLQLDRDLSPDTYQIHLPDPQLSSVGFSFTAASSRSPAIHVNQHGLGPNDVSKRAYLSLWLPNGPADGSIDFRDYITAAGFQLRWELRTSSNELAGSGPISHRMAPQTAETGGSFPRSYERYDGSSWQANRAGTHVFDIDFSALSPAPGEYRIVIPHLGCSYPFTIADDAWYQASRVAMQGLYHHRSGMALDGRFGYTRPRSQHPADGTQVFQSAMPLVMSKEGTGGGLYTYSAATHAAFLSNRIHTEAWGGWMDAGDWDRRIQHLEATLLLFDIYDHLPQQAKNADYGLPASGSVLPDNIYAGLDLPDLLDEAVWNLDLYRRLQISSGPHKGAVHGGIEDAGASQKFHTSFLTDETVFVYAPDPVSSFYYAAVAARAAVTLKQLAPAAAAVYEQSAKDAWSWAEAANADTSMCYDPALDAADAYERAEGRNARTASQRRSIITNWVQRSQDYRMWAAAALYRLTGRASYDAAFRSHVRTDGNGNPAISNNPQGPRQHAFWEYHHSQHPGVDRTLQTWFAQRLPAHTRTWMVNALLNDEVAFPALKHKSAPLGWGSGSVPRQLSTFSTIRSHILSGDDDFLRALQDASAFVLGANPINLSLTIGLGDRQTREPLHIDHKHMGVPPPTGITIYGFNPWNTVTAWWLYDASWSDMYVDDPDRQIYPSRKAIPFFEWVMEHPEQISTMEYTIQQTIVTTAAAWAYLGRHGSHGDGRQSQRRIRMRSLPAQSWTITPAAGRNSQAAGYEIFAGLSVQNDHLLELRPGGNN